MFKTSLELNGRPVRSGALGRELEKAMVKEVEDSVKKTVSQVHCRTHGQVARVTVRGRTLRNMEFDISGCCDDLVNEVRQRLGAR